MSHELIQDIGKIFLAGLIMFAALGVLRDAGMTGFASAPTGALAYSGPEKIFTKQGATLVLDLEYYFSGARNIVYTAVPAEGIDVQFHKNLLFIMPAKDFSGASEVTVYASNKEQITKQKIKLNVEPIAPVKKCSCGS